MTNCNCCLLGHLRQSLTRSLCRIKRIVNVLIRVEPAESFLLNVLTTSSLNQCCHRQLTLIKILVRDNVLPSAKVCLTKHA